MSSADRHPPVPPPPPGRRVRLEAWLRRTARGGHGRALIAAATVLGALIGLVIATLVGLLLQPRFTVLELGAQRLAPGGLDAQPPIEQVADFSAFDRHYTVEFATPPGGRAAVVDHARRQRWQVIARGADDTVRLERDGVRADVTVAGDVTTVETRVARWVRTRQRQAQILALVVGGLWAGVAVWRVIRRQPRLVVERDR